jgi:hypothetical protein
MARRVELRNKILLWAVVVVALYAASLVLFDPRVELEPATVESAMAEASGYLIRHLGTNGRFEYVIHLEGLPLEDRYNVLRHAGTVYALALYHELTADAQTREAILRAARYLLRWHVRPVAQQKGMLAVFSLPREEVDGTNAQVKLGGCALGAIALIKARQLDADVVSLNVLREIGNFILFMQEENGHFRSKYEENGRFSEGFESIYYPGEAILALALLHKVDPDPRWLDAALKGIAYLEKSRQGLPIRQLPNDHWLMIAADAVLPHYEAAQAPPISRKRLIDHAFAIGKMMMDEQWRTSLLPGMKGSFVSDGAITPSSTRLEGLIALFNLLPSDHPDRSQIQKSIERGLGFILRAQVREGDGKGGFTRALRKLPEITKQSRETNLQQSEIRIDYVQHALSAMVGYHKMRSE